MVKSNFRAKYGYVYLNHTPCFDLSDFERNWSDLRMAIFKPRATHHHTPPHANTQTSRTLTRTYITPRSPQPMTSSTSDPLPWMSWQVPTCHLCMPNPTGHTRSTQSPARSRRTRARATETCLRARTVCDHTRLRATSTLFWNEDDLNF